jgi:hypothetical protein
LEWRLRPTPGCSAIEEEEEEEEEEDLSLHTNLDDEYSLTGLLISTIYIYTLSDDIKLCEVSVYVYPKFCV